MIAPAANPDDATTALAVQLCAHLGSEPIVRVEVPSDHPTLMWVVTYHHKMGGIDLPKRIQRLKNKIETELEKREDVTGFEFHYTEEPGIHVEVDEADETRIYHVTLEQLPDGTEETHWSYLGGKYED